MAIIDASGGYTVISEGYVAQGEIDQSEGRRGRRELGRYSTVEEAYEAARGKGTQGDHGYVLKFELRHYEGGAVREHTILMLGRPAIAYANGDYSVGWLNPDGSRWTGPKGTYPA